MQRLQNVYDSSLTIKFGLPAISDDSIDGMEEKYEKHTIYEANINHQIDAMTDDKESVMSLRMNKWLN